MSMNAFKDAAYSLEGVLSEKHGLDDIQTNTLKRAAVALHNANLVLRVLEEMAPLFSDYVKYDMVADSSDSAVIQKAYDAIANSKFKG